MIKKFFLISISSFFLVSNIFSMTVPPVPFRNTEDFNGGIIGINALFQILLQSDSFCKLIHNKSAIEENYYFQALEEIRNSIMQQEIIDLSVLNTLLTDDCDIQDPLILLLKLLEKLEIDYSHYLFENGNIYDVQNHGRLIEFWIDCDFNFEIIIIPVLNLIILCPRENFIISDYILNNFEIFFCSFFKLLKKLYQDSTNYFQEIDFEAIGYIQKIENYFIASVKHKEFFYQCNDETDEKAGVIKKINLSNDFDNFFNIFYSDGGFPCMFFLKITEIKNAEKVKSVISSFGIYINEIKRRLKFLKIKSIEDFIRLIKPFELSCDEVNKIAEIILYTTGAVEENTSILTKKGIDILASCIAKKYR